MHFIPLYSNCTHSKVFNFLSRLQPAPSWKTNLMPVNLQLTSVLTMSSVVNGEKEKRDPARCLCRDSTLFHWVFPDWAGKSCDFAKLCMRIGGNFLNLVAFTICSRLPFATRHLYCQVSYRIVWNKTKQFSGGLVSVSWCQRSNRADCLETVER